MDGLPATTPASVEEFQARLVQVSENLPRRLRQCADYIAANTDRIAVSTVAELAQGADVPPSALMRFCQILGFSGFSEMQRLFREDYTQGRPDYATRLRNLKDSGAGSPAALLGEFVDAGRQSLESLARNADLAALDAAVGVLAKASMVHVIGLRRAFPVASYLVYALEKMDIPSLLHSSVGKLDQRHAMRPGDALIAITFAPYSEETLTLSRDAARKGLPVVAITDTAISPVSASSAHLLTVPEVDFGAFRSLSATLALAISLAVAIGSARASA
ncbi:MAG: MurR/RpiR family transcriptional regulator [Paracoccaceae bacterium]